MNLGCLPRMVTGWTDSFSPTLTSLNINPLKNEILSTHIHRKDVDFGEEAVKNEHRVCTYFINKKKLLSYLLKIGAVGKLSVH